VKKKTIGLALSAMLLAPCSVAEAQQPAKIPRIGMLRPDSPPNPAVEAFRQGLRDLGYVEGRNIVVEFRYAEGKLDRLRDLAAELVRIKVDIIVTSTDPGARAAKNATKTIPIVMMGVGTDPVETGLVESLARPGANITGLTLLSVETSSKRPELLKEIVPKLARVAVLYDSTNRGNLTEVKQVQTAARPLGLTVKSWAVKDAGGFETVFAALSKERPDGLYVAGGALMISHEKLVTDFTLKSRLPSTFDRPEAVDAGGLMSYGADRVDQFRRAAIYVDKILKGAKPAELPVEQPTKFELVINLKTAKQIGLTIPQSVLFRADRVIR
jgi:putative ABC transport system substrate-binding protein